MVSVSGDEVQASSLVRVAFQHACSRAWHVYYGHCVSRRASWCCWDYVFSLLLVRHPKVAAAREAHPICRGARVPAAHGKSVCLLLMAGDIASAAYGRSACLLCLKQECASLPLMAGV
eukprot:1159590-Pelagomonas_calceolata.AAC.3